MIPPVLTIGVVDSLARSDCIESRAVLDLRTLRHSGIARGQRTVVGWRDLGGRILATAGLVWDDPARICFRAGNRDVVQSLALEWRPCRFGGNRSYWRCSRCGCAREALVFDLAAFSCRLCAGLTYQAAVDGKLARLVRRAYRGEATIRVGKTSGSRWARYAKDIEEAQEAVRAARHGLDDLYRQVLDRPMTSAMRRKDDDE